MRGRLALAGPFLLLTVVTSLGFHRAQMARQREEDRRRYQVQIALLQEELKRVTELDAAGTATRGLLKTRLHTSTGSDEDEQVLARRCLLAGLDPIKIGIAPRALPVDYQRYREDSDALAKGGQVSWKQAFFGDGVTQRVKMSAARAAEALRATLGSSSGQRQDSASRSVQDSEATDEWEKGESTAPSGRESDQCWNIRLTEPEPQYSRPVTAAFLAFAASHEEKDRAEQQEQTQQTDTADNAITDRPAELQSQGETHQDEPAYVQAYQREERPEAENNAATSQSRHRGRRQVFV